LTSRFLTTVWRRTQPKRTAGAGGAHVGGEFTTGERYK
jgi:hypothetical protein